MISDELKKKALDFLAEIENLAKDDGYQVAKDDFDSQYAMLKDEYETKIKKAYDLGMAEGETAAKRLFDDLIAQMKADYDAKVKAAYNEGYNARAAEESGASPVVNPDPEPIDEPVDDPVNEGYSREKVISELLAIKGSSSYAFGIVDVNGNVYANASEWILDGKQDVLGIGFTNGTLHLCMHAKKIASAPYGAIDVKVDGVYHTKLQWKKDSKPNQPSAYEDYSGAKNSDALVANCPDSIAHKAHAVVFANGKHGYLPPCGELRIYCQYHAKVDELLKAVGGDAIYSHKGTYNESMWSSTAIDAKQAWVVLYSETHTQPAQRNKSVKCPIRVFVEL